MGTLPSPEALRVSLSTPPLALQSATDSPAARATQPNPTVLRYFDDVFRETPATKRRDIEAAFRLRYQVYCLDRGYESAADCPDDMEQDCYDDSALHCLLQDRAKATPIGTVRLVRPTATPTWFSELPLADYAPQESIEDIIRLPAGATAEVSRFAITRSAREILQGTDKPISRECDPLAGQGTLGERLLPYMSLGLIRGLVRLSVEHGITHWCLAAEPSLLRRLRHFGLHFCTTGPLFDHRGLRQICYANLFELLERARVERPEFWDIITVGGFLVSAELAQSAA